MYAEVDSSLTLIVFILSDDGITVSAVLRSILFTGVFIVLQMSHLRIRTFLMLVPNIVTISDK